MTGVVSESSRSLVAKACLFCPEGTDEVLFPERLEERSLTGEAFSARRARRLEHFRVVRCRGCGLVRSDPILPEGKLQDLYGESQFLFSEEMPFAAETYAELFVRVVFPRCGRPERLLEIGCSTGFFLKKALGLGISQVLGIEPSLACRQAAPPDIRERILPGFFSPEPFQALTFDGVASFHVLDHVADPRAFVRDIHRVLDPGGILLLVVHDVESLTARLAGEFSPIFDVEHVFLFSRPTLSRLLREEGFQILHGGSLRNRYPLGYWLRMVPFFQRLVGFLPGAINRIPISVKPGNLFCLARKI